MAATAFLPSQPTAIDSTFSKSSSTSSSASPTDQASLASSVSSLDEDTVSLPQKETSPYGTLLDTYGDQFQVPNFTIKQIRDAIPPHCFERSALRGYSYVLRDLALLATTFYTFRNYVTPTIIPSYPLRFALWGLYTVLQGFFGTGLWVIAHECGHQSFSPSKTINDATGWVLHSALLVPYFSWKISHGKHHKSTGHMERDMVFLPKTRDIYASRLGKMVHEVVDLTEETPIATLIYIIGRQIVGWPFYLLINKTGHGHHERQIEGRGVGKKNGLGGGVNHFNPNSPLFEAKDANLIVLSDIGLAITGSVLYFIGQKFGAQNLLVWYFLPYLWVNNWLVAITFLQHTDPTLPHYGPETWTFTRGAATTIDREFGFIGRSLLHGIIETHVLHHYVSTIPFYHADEATEAIKPIMGQHYRSDVKDGPVGFLKSMWSSTRYCQWVEPSEGAEGAGKDILFYRNRNGLGVPPSRMQAKAA